MNKEELIESLKLTRDSYSNEDRFRGGVRTGLGIALGVIEKLEEPEKVVIPKFVIEWWERDGDSVTLYGGLRVDKRHKFSLISAYIEGGLDDGLLNVEMWIDENKSAFLDLVNGKSYEGEKEKLYTVELNNDHITHYLAYDMVYKVFFISRNREEKLNKVKKKFTEKEIRDYDERYWNFAVEVVEE